jgi:hypothetical protein
MPNPIKYRTPTKENPRQNDCSISDFEKSKIGIIITKLIPNTLGLLALIQLYQCM